MNALTIKNLNYSIDNHTILKDINLEVREGDFLIIRGPNGGGKSTLLKLIAGILRPTSGTIEIFGKNKGYNDMIGYVPQNTDINLTFPISVQDVITTGIKREWRSFLFGNTKEKEVVAEVMDLCRITEFKDRKISSLSGGQRQKVMIARALCAKPKLLLLDEPASSIDKEGREQICSLLEKLNKKMSIVLVSHNTTEPLSIESKTVYINKSLEYV